MGCVLDELGTDEEECRRKVASGRIVLYDPLLVPVFMYGSETMIWKENEKCRIISLQMDNLKGLQGIRRMDKVPNARIKELCGVTKGMDEKIDEGILRWFCHVERTENDRNVIRVYVGVCW